MIGSWFITVARIPLIVLDKSAPNVTTANGLHTIHKYNDNYYIIVRNGDTFKSLGKELDLSYRKLAKYNERDKHDRLVPGEFIWLKKSVRKLRRTSRIACIMCVSQRVSMILRRSMVSV